MPAACVPPGGAWGAAGAAMATAACVLHDAPSNPPAALATALRAQLSLGATPRLLPGAAEGERTVVFGSSADATAALAATDVRLLGCPVRLRPTAPRVPRRPPPREPACDGRRVRIQVVSDTM